MVNYNSGEFLEQAILSVLNQSCKHFELIIVDGGSSDKSINIINKYKDSFAWCVSEPDKGQSDAFNKGFEHAKGEYFVWLNADDLMLPKTLELVKQEIDLHPKKKWISLNSAYIDKNNKIWRAYKTPPYSCKIFRNGNIEMGGPSSFFHRSIYEQCGPFVLDYHYLMDIDLWIKFRNAGYKLHRLTNFGWAFRDHEASKTSSSLKGKPSVKFLKEKIVVRETNNYNPNSFILLIQMLYRIIYSYPLALYYSRKYNNKDIKELEQ